MINDKFKTTHEQQEADDFWESEEASNIAFEDWYDSPVGFHINSERIVDNINGSINDGGTEVCPFVLRHWMQVCWNAALDAAEEYNGISLKNLRTPLDTL